MCCWRMVKSIYTCGHLVREPDVEVQCDFTTCRFSPAHPPNCVPPRCTQTCWQYRQFPQQYVLHIDNSCPECLRLQRGVNARNRNFVGL